MESKIDSQEVQEVESGTVSNRSDRNFSVLDFHPEVTCIFVDVVDLDSCRCSLLCTSDPNQPPSPI